MRNQNLTHHKLNHPQRCKLRPGLRRHRGVALIWTTVTFILLIGFVSLAVDLGRIEVAQSELQEATDAAARYAAAGLENILYGQSAAAANAAAVALNNTVDGTPLVIDQNSDVQIGFWSTSAHTFTPETDPTQANAVRVTAVRSAARGDAIPMTFLALLGQPTFDIRATSTAMLTPAPSVTLTIPATSNPFLAGQPKNVSASNNNPHNDPDWSAGSTIGNIGGKHVEASPIVVPNSIPVNAGQSMTFDGINGGANNDYTFKNRYTADGNMGWSNCTNTVGDEHGIANMKAPINSLVGVYLDNSVPGSNPAPADLDFSDATARDYTTLNPQLSQLFFIGDGRTSTGEVQHVVVPKKATRLFIGTWDTYEWNNNIGAFSVTVHGASMVTTVQ